MEEYNAHVSRRGCFNYIQCQYKKRMYDTIFHFLDSIPTIPFVFSFAFSYLALLLLIHVLLHKTVSYSILDYRKQSNILCYVAQLSVIVPICLIEVTALWRGDFSLIHTNRHKPNVQVGDVSSTTYSDLPRW